MMGKISLLGALVFLGILLVIFSSFPSVYSAEQQTGTTKMNVTIRGWVSISASSCITAGITFNETDQNTRGNNATCNWGQGDNGGSGYNLTLGTETTVNVNFTHASNRSNLTTGTYEIGIANVTYNSNSTEDNGSNMLNNDTATALSTNWDEMEDCTNLDKSTKTDCWETYFLNVPSAQPPGDYETGYCWCGRRTNTAETNCGSCT